MLNKTQKLAMGTLLAAGLAGAAGQAKANHTTYTYTFSNVNVGTLYTQSLDLFNSNLGTLTNVSMSIAGTNTGSITYTNTGSLPVFYNSLGSDFVSATFKIANTGATHTYLSLTGTTFNDTFSATGTVFPGTPVTASGVGTAYNKANAAVGNLADFQQAGGGVAANFLNFTSPGVSTSYFNPGTLTAGSSISTGGTLIVDYTWNPAGPVTTPEPGTWALLVATGSVSLLGYRRRRSVR